MDNGRNFRDQTVFDLRAPVVTSDIVMWYVVELPTLCRGLERLAKNDVDWHWWKDDVQLSFGFCEVSGLASVDQKIFAHFEQLTASLEEHRITRCQGSNAPLSFPPAAYSSSYHKTLRDIPAEPAFNITGVKHFLPSYLPDIAANHVREASG